ncbi:hypothetical protein OAT16_06450 [Prolixibacteraceae bacterium]|nr:hypothetical protein [Prolixibacteraceae bacterium]
MKQIGQMNTDFIVVVDAHGIGHGLDGFLKRSPKTRRVEVQGI